MTGSLFAFQDELAAIKSRGLYRQRRVINGPQGVFIRVDGHRRLNFCSNDYLGHANHPAVVKAYQQAILDYGVGSGSAHLICGHSKAHQALEEELAALTGRQRALLFSTGYMANIGAISALMSRGDVVFQDRLNHASLLDGGVLAGARLKRYGHGQMASLEAALKQSKAARKLIVTDGVFSMDGDLAPLPELSALAARHQAGLMVDDAHGMGVLGDRGAGIVELYGLSAEDVPILVGTLGKALGTFGAFVAGSEALIELFIQKARSYIYTTALPPAIAEATRASLKLLNTQSWRRRKLLALVDRFRIGAKQLGLPIMSTITAIQPLLIGDAQKTLQISQALFREGLLVSAIRPPTVPQDTARLRITFSADHEEQHIDILLAALEKIFYESAVL